MRFLGWLRREQAEPLMLRNVAREAEAIAACSEILEQFEPVAKASILQYLSDGHQTNADRVEAYTTALVVDAADNDYTRSPKRSAG